MTGKELKEIREKSGLTQKVFYEEILGLGYMQYGQASERMYEVSESIANAVEEAIKSGKIRKDGEK